MPDQRRPNSPTQQDESGDDADQADFEAANVSRLLRIIAVQKSPEECGKDDGEKSRLRRPQQKWNCEQAKEKFLARRGVDADRQRIDPGHVGADHVFVIEVLRRPCAQSAADNVENRDVADVRGGEANADDVGAKKFFGANAGQAESNVEPDFIGLKDAIQRFSRHDGEDNKQCADNAHQGGLAHLAQEKTGIGRVGIVLRAIERPLIHGHDEVQNGDENAECEADAPFQQAAAAQRNDDVEASADQERVRKQRDVLKEIVGRTQALVIEIPGFRNFQEFVVAADAVARQRDGQAVGRVFRAESAALPGETPVAARGTLGEVRFLFAKIVE